MNVSPDPVPSGDSLVTSTRLGHSPGTPRPPMDPPRRRSSLAFSRILSCDSTPDRRSKHIDSSPPSPPRPNRTPSNTGRKRQPRLPTASTPTPGHVAQMQRLFQTAKASLRFDVRFAASPIGSIGSRLPVNDTEAEENMLGADEIKTLEVANSNRNWRYSSAPKLVALPSLDVREPFPDASLDLPDLTMLDPHTPLMMDTEPISSGFASPVEAENGESDDRKTPDSTQHKGSLIVDGEDMQTESADTASISQIPVTDLEEPMTGLKVSSEVGDNDMDMEESPIVSHLKRLSGTGSSKARLSIIEDKEIFLSAPAKAAADSARAKRGLMRQPALQQSPEHHLRDTRQPAQDVEPENLHLDACPDPTLHQHNYLTICPNPSAHYNTVDGKGPVPRVMVTPEADYHPQYNDSPILTTYPFPQKMPPFHRASSTGSPMPFARLRSPMNSPSETNSYTGQSLFSSKAGLPDRYLQNPRPSSRRNDGVVADEHFQPGWYYARQPRDLSNKNMHNLYSFSTAAGKAVGQSVAPDSMIRNSYRTDTLTPLAKPQSRFRKNGLATVLESKGAESFHSSYRGRPHLGDRAEYINRRRPHDRHNDTQPRSSLPGTYGTPSLSRHKRGRNIDCTETEVYAKAGDLYEPTEGDANPILEDGDELMDVDEDTQAAVRLSLYANAEPELPTSTVAGPREISPNVAPWRKATRPRKKRRPSYWDSDLEEVRSSPAARHVQRGPMRQIMTSPIKHEVGVAQQARLSYNENEFTEENDSTGKVSTQASHAEAKNPDLADVEVDMVVDDITDPNTEPLNTIQWH